VFIFAPYSHYDEPKTLSYFTKPICLLNADRGHPAADKGHHFFRQEYGRKFGIPSIIMDSPLNDLRPNGISRGDFYELHFKVDRTYPGSRLPASAGGGGWYGRSLGLEKYGTLGRIWYGSPTLLKATVAGTTITAGGVIYANSNDGD
jgi:hypothetical protein